MASVYKKGPFFFFALLIAVSLILHDVCRVCHWLQQQQYVVVLL